MDVEDLLEAPLKGEAFLSSIEKELDTSRKGSSRDDRRSDRGSESGRSSSRRDRDSRRRSRSRSRSYDRYDRRRDDRSSRRSSDRHRDDRDDRRDDRDRDRDRDSRKRDDRRDSERRRSRSPPRRRDRRSPREEEKPAREESPKLTEEEHEMRSVFVSSLSARIGDRELTAFFETNAGPVRDSRVIVDRISRRSKGVAYVEFRDLDTVQKALSLSGTKLLGVPVMVQYTEAERNRQANINMPAPENANIVIPEGSDAHPNAPIPYNRLYVGSLAFALTEQDLRQVFEPFGAVDIVELHRDPVTNKSKGYAFVQYRFQKDARIAIDKMNNFSLAGRPIRVGLVTEKMTMMTEQSRDTKNFHNFNNLDDPDRGGNLSGISRIELMHKLSREGDRPAAIPKNDMWKPNIPTATSKCVLLKNMFDPAEETEPNWDTELRDDVKMEVESKYGKVADIFVVKDSQGEIYVKFDNNEDSAKAMNGLNGRFFGGKRVVASYLSEAIFSAQKPR